MVADLQANDVSNFAGKCIYIPSNAKQPKETKDALKQGALKMCIDHFVIFNNLVDYFAS